ncbi:hypothetical protein AAFF_G00202500 [Aldrovandia affinis]|uniref:Uncharacterized protein n=1 Tax=Aldrovandia affinis TaxID=143900 RepID=A0AAD7SWW0_9TELE|nr:hypothetical protein AAFF_G00202500 [Aldrovandia affinis]
MAVVLWELLILLYNLWIFSIEFSIARNHVIFYLITYLPESGGDDGRLLGFENIDIKESGQASDQENVFSTALMVIPPRTWIPDPILLMAVKLISALAVVLVILALLWRAVLAFKSWKRLLKENENLRVLNKVFEDKCEELQSFKLNICEEINDRDLKIEQVQLLNKELEMKGITSAEKLSAEEQQRCFLEDKIKALSCENAQLKGRINIVELEVTTLIMQERTLQETLAQEELKQKEKEEKTKEYVKTLKNRLKGCQRNKKHTERTYMAEIKKLEEDVKSRNSDYTNQKN